MAEKRDAEVKGWASEPAARVIELASLDTAFSVKAGDEGTARRRLMTLLAYPAGDGRHGPNEILRAQNTAGETFACKILAPSPADADPQVRRGREAALYEEYRNQLAVSYLRGFPTALGYGTTRAGDPLILMEWVDGPTLYQALPLLADGTGENGENLCPAQAVAAVGASVLATLAATTHLDGLFAHRDVSPRNIMLRGNAAGLAGRVADGSLETCLIDLGSSIFVRGEDASFTMTTDVWRNATPEFAPPEMLQPRAQQTLQQRCSAAIDVYELCGVLYLMYAGHTPYRVAERGGAVAAEIKAEPAPALEARDPVDAPLLDAIMAGLAPAAEKRPRAAELLEAVCSWQRSRGYAVPRDAENTPAPMPGEHGAAHLTIAASGRGGLNAGVGTNGGAPGTSRPSGTQTAPSRTLTRRRAIQAAGAAAGVAVLAGAAWATRGFGLLGEPAFKDRSWADLSSLAREIAGADDEKAALEAARQHGLLTDDGLLRDDLAHDLALADGTAATVQVVGIYHDDRADGSGKAGLTFAFTTPIAERAMADDPMASGGWKQCDARAWLADEGLALLPKDLAKRIVEVSKMTNNTGATQDAGNVTATSDKLWLFSIAELGGPRDESTFSVGYRYLAAILSAEGSQYRLWKQQGVSARSGNTALERLDGSTPYQWWNRSPSPDVSADEKTVWFNRVGENGDPFHFAKAASDATDHPRLLPGFCL